MLTVSFNISYNNVTKKLACSKSQTVNQLIQNALEKFKLDGQQGQLFHNGKKLDSSLPLRLTNLVNNSKLALVTSGASNERVVNIKLAINARNEVASYVLKTSNARTLHEILEDFEKTHGCTIHGAGEFELAVLNSKISSNSKGINSSLKSIVGDVSSLLMRLTYPQASTNTGEQEQINERQKQNMRDYQRNEREKREAEQRLAKQHDTETKSFGPSGDPNEPRVHGGSPLTGPAMTHHHQSDTNAYKNPESIGTTPGRPEIQKKTTQETPAHTDTLYAPSKFSTYENPDDDYEMTVHQAQKYHQMIVNSSKKSSAPKPKPTPSRYSIRIKFPDRLMLQLEIDDANAKMGYLIRKIDQYLVPHFQSSYNLRMGYPPFSAIPFSLANNSSSLAESPFFQDEKVVLIWEPLPLHTSGPYIVESEADHAKGINDLPQIQLESNRSSLPADTRIDHPHTAVDAPATFNTHANTHIEPHTAKPPTSHPKWFRPSR